MRLAIRTTCGRAIGFGHLRRCLTLAEELLRRGHAPEMWITGDESGPKLAAEAGVAAGRIEPGVEALEARLSSIDALLIDDYALSEADFARLHGAVPLAVIDDLADRALDADLVQNGNAGARELAYRTPPDCQLLLGPRYSLLRAAFRARPARTAPPLVRRVLVMLGGSDARGLTARMTHLCLQTIPGASVDVVVGPLAAPVEELGRLGPRVSLHRAPPNLLSLMEEADLAVSGGGQTNYELAAVGLPALSICVADNQRGNLAALARVPTLLAAFDDSDAALVSLLERLARDRELRQIMSVEGQKLVDGLGATRVAEALEALTRRKEENG